MTRNVSIACACLIVLMIQGCSSGPRIRHDQIRANDKRQREALRLSAKGDRAASNGDLAAAEKYYRESISLDGNLFSSWNNLGVLLMKRENYIDAVDTFNRAADLMPGDPRPPTNAGLAYHNAGFDADAMRYYQEALRRDPRWLDALRGATASGMRLMTYNEQSLDIVRRGLLIEHDEEWRLIFSRERIRIENALERSRSE